MRPICSRRNIVDLLLSALVFLVLAPASLAAQTETKTQPHAEVQTKAHHSGRHGHRGDGVSPKQIDAALRLFVEENNVPIAGVALAVRVGDRLVYEGAAGCALFENAQEADGVQGCKRALQPASPFRAASVSKMAVALGISSLVADGDIDLDADVSDYIGWRLRNPAYPDRAITVSHLLSHTSSVRDPEEYWVAAPGAMTSLFTDPATVFDASTDNGDRGPGSFFTYSNLNFGLLATVIENVSGQRFDLFVGDRVLAPLGLDAGFNWSNVKRATRKSGAALYRQTDGVWVATVDEDAMRIGTAPYFLTAPKTNRKSYLKSYAPGHNATLFSPQGGLRASVSDLTKLVRRAAADPRLRDVIWTYDRAAANGNTEENYFTAFGRSVQHVAGNDDFLAGENLIGHPGEAYGLYSGAWVAPADPAKGRPDDIAFAFAITGAGGAPGKGNHPTFNALEEQLVRLALHGAALDAEGVRAKSDDPRPYDKTRNAMADVDVTLAAAMKSGRRPLLVLGANWCHDSRGLAAKFETPALAQLIGEHFELAYIDVGQRDRNISVAQRFGVDEIRGTPTVLILSPSGELLNAESVHDWRTAHSIPMDETIAYFSRFAPPKDEAPSP